MIADLQRRRAILFILACTAALSIHSILLSSVSSIDHVKLEIIIEGTEDEFHRILYDIDGSDEDDDAELLAIPAFLLDNDENGNNNSIPQEEEDSLSTTTITSYAQLIDTNRPLPPYTIEDALQVSKLYDSTFALLVYDPEDDMFIGLYSENHRWRPPCQKLTNSFRNIAYLLRKIFPERFRGTESDELVIPIGSGDYPGVKVACLEHYRKQANDPKAPKWYLKRIKDISCNDYLAPILQFGSVFRRPDIFPNMIGMPVPEPNHLSCFEYWAENEEICEHLLPSLPDRGKAMMVYGKEFGIEWEDLIPQVVWRGTDFSYLSNASPLLDKAHFDEHLIKWPWEEQGEKEMTTNIIGGGLSAYSAASMKERLEKKQKTNPRGPFVTKNAVLLKEFSKAAALKAMKDEYKSLFPRWQAVVLTAEAEVDATGHDDLPWANMKFSNFVINGQKVPTVGAEQYKEWEDIDFPATGEHMDLPELARYKYHIDLGGGGGTTWSGTIEKLAMPGLLFHHMTPTKDYIHDYMKPWLHYVPVAADLSDLKEKYEWAESHPVKAKKIADEGTKLIRYLTSKEGFQDMFDKDMVEPLRRVIDSYQPISTIQEDRSWSSWKDAIDQIEGKVSFTSVIECRNPLNLGSKTFFIQAVELVCQELRDKKRYLEFKGGNIGWTEVH